MNWLSKHWFRFNQALGRFIEAKGLVRIHSPEEIPGLQVLRDVGAVFDLRKVAIVGGAIRNVVHAVAASDIDVAVWGVTAVEFDSLLRGLYAKGYKPVPIVDEGDLGYDGESGQRLDQVRRFESPCYERVDFLLFTSRHNSLERVLASFDYSINQYAFAYYQATGLAREDDSFPTVRLNYFPIGECHRLRATISPEREARMRDVAQELGWKYIDDPRQYA